MANKTLKVLNFVWDFCQLDSPMCNANFGRNCLISNTDMHIPPKTLGGPACTDPQIWTCESTNREMWIQQYTLGDPNNIFADPENKYKLQIDKY